MGLAFILGIVVTFATGVFNTTPGIVGATWYGWPMSWLKRLVVAPQYNPWRLAFPGFALDVLFWFAIFWVVLFVWFSTEKGGKRNAKKPTARRRR